MKYADNERGVALVMALILSLIALAAVSAMLYLVSERTQMSGFQKRYQTALEAAKGAVDLWGPEVISKTIGSKDLSGTKNDIIHDAPVEFPSTTSDACLQQKLTLPWISWGSCGSDNKTNFDPTVNPDAIVTFAGGYGTAEFKAYAKILDDFPGNSDTSGGGQWATNGGVVQALGTGGGGTVSPQLVPYLYRMEVQAQRTTNPDERARLSVLHAY